MPYKINWSVTDGAFAVPDYVVDTLLKNINPASAKIILYIFRHKDKCSFDPKEIAEAAGKGVSVEDVEDALSEMMLTRLIYEEGTPALASGVQTGLPGQSDGNVHSAANKLSGERSRERAAKMLTPQEITDRINENNEISFLFYETEEMLGRVLNHTEHRALIWMYDYYGLKADIILMIIDYCKSIDKASFGYIEKIAKSWHEKEISTHETASEEIKRMQSYRTLEGKIKSRLELNRAFNTAEREFISVWNSYGYDIEHIMLAYDKTTEAINKLSFRYMNSIICKWHDMGYYNIEDIKRAALDYKIINSKKAGTVPGKSAEQPQKKTKSSYDLNKIFEYSKNNIPDFKE